MISHHLSPPVGWWLYSHIGLYDSIYIYIIHNIIYMCIIEYHIWYMWDSHHPWEVRNLQAALALAKSQNLGASAPESEKAATPSPVTTVTTWKTHETTSRKMGFGWIWMDLDVWFPFLRFLSSKKELEARIGWFGQLDETFTHDRQIGHAWPAAGWRSLYLRPGSLNSSCPCNALWFGTHPSRMILNCSSRSAEDESYVWSLGDVQAAMHDGRLAAGNFWGPKLKAAPARTGAALDSRGDQLQSFTSSQLWQWYSH